ncbi:MAG: hypothetical protein PHG82_02705 [Candidatus Gracilibacteria bacterium]|nr:hypothetical protein [Candidatus Gracilibacteria bacterium]
MKSRTIFGPISPSKKLFKEEKEIGEKFKDHPVVIFTGKVIDLVSSILKKF